MALLTAQQRAEVTAELMRRNPTSFGGITKAQLRAVVDAADDWANTNAAAYNAAVPQPQRGVMATEEKALALSLVIERRYIERV